MNIAWLLPLKVYLVTSELSCVVKWCVSLDSDSDRGKNHICFKRPSIGALRLTGKIQFQMICLWENSHQLHRLSLNPMVIMSGLFQVLLLMILNIGTEILSSVDPDQTEVWMKSALFVIPLPSFHPRPILKQFKENRYTFRGSNCHFHHSLPS